MKIWTSEHIFNHPWETVTHAAWRKYPNPMNPAVTAIDVVDRQVCNGILKTHRLIATQWGLPSWASKQSVHKRLKMLHLGTDGACSTFCKHWATLKKLLGADKTFYASEHSEVNPRSKTMTSMSKNLSFCNEVSVIEKLTYSPHPTKSNCTLLKQEAVVTIRDIPLSSYIESYIAQTISSNAGKGRQAMEWVINKINGEVHDLTNKTVKSMDEITLSAKKGMAVVDDFTSAAKKSMGDLNHFAEETLPNLHFEK